ncbi:hypothetical protein GCM10011584_30250 [Nocardioides phosphati]|uniref:Fibronectin type-III domain-containing protein n=1 Tax=Nocardioides phosphati TaxID=1867775 RepID=A0ABQ2ND89_9ACTN|nr:M23 family metallopeptidase [Nocardioides phosphati]GGO92862.1 hypothetical protein GCM10011584_30250 [Nocardioides phosphati]
MSLRHVVITVAATAAAVAGLSMPSAHAPAAAAVTVDASHPYSDPVWWPLRDWSQNDCYNTNCTKDGKPHHGTWEMDLDAIRQKNGVPDTHGEYPTDDPVHAMGAGIVHIGAPMPCDSRGSHRGNWVWVDHGNGVTSTYGHLGSIRVTEGAYVTPSTQLGTVGQSGSCTTSTIQYLYLAVSRGGQLVEIKTMNACRADTGARVTWPEEQYPDAVSYRSGTTAKTWNNLLVPTTQPHQYFPPADGTCIPSGGTPDQPATPYASRPASHQLAFRWTKGTLATSSTVELQSRVCSSSGTCKWIASRKATTTGSTYTFGALDNGRRYRARVWLHNSVGYSKQSAWKEATPSA